MDSISEERKRGKFRTREFLANNFSFIGFALVVVLFEILTQGKLLGARNMMNIFNDFFTIGLGALGLIFVMSLGELDLSVGAIVGFSAAIGSFAADASLVLILPACLISGLLIGLMNGLLVSRLHVESFIETLAMSFVIRGITTFLLNGTRGIGIAMRVFDGDIIKVATFAVVAVACYILYEYTMFGKHIRSVGSIAEAARQSGVPVEKTKLLAFMLCGLLCGIVGFFCLVRACTASTKTGNAFEFSTLLAVVFGGMPLTGGWPVRFRSALVGSVSMAVITSGMSLMGLSGLTQQIVQGAILIGVVTLSFDRRNAVVIK
jgi:Ribose/xylose/arabinose/galactoside ABC-type transport systems, permease components